MASSFLRFLDHTQRRTTVGRTPLDVWSARRRDLYLTTHKSPGGIRTYDLSRRAAVDLRLRLRGHRDRHWEILQKYIELFRINKTDQRSKQIAHSYGVLQASQALSNKFVEIKDFVNMSPRGASQEQTDMW